MKRFTIQIVESRDLIFHIEADSEEEAAEIANEMDTTEAVRDGFRSREHDWTVEGYI
jgi:hypothetical protein